MIRSFFSYDIGVPFELFGFLHFFISALTIIGIILIYKNQDSLRKWKYKEKVRYFSAGILFANMSIYYISLAMLGLYNWKIHLPLHLCFITGYIFMAVLISGNKKLFRVVYFFTFIGPLPAMLWPDLVNGFDRFIFYQFIISHHFMFLVSIFCLVVLEYSVERKDMLKAFVCGNVLLSIIYFFNKVCGTNYIMMNELPAHVVKMFPFINMFGSPIFWLELCGFVALIIAYIPVAIKHRLPNKT